MLTKRFYYSDGTHFGTGVSVWYPVLKSVNCIPTFEKMLQLGPFQKELTNTVNDVPLISLWFF